MQIERTLSEIHKTVKAYELLLEKVSEETFKTNPAEGVWSYAEVFSHIFRSNMSCIDVIVKCANGEAIEHTGGMSFFVRLVFYFKRFPPGIRFKVPKKLRYMVEKIGKEEARKLISDFNASIDHAAQCTLGASPTQKIKHPRMGMLNAGQWLTFIEIHTKHHRRQLDRISKQLQVL